MRRLAFSMLFFLKLTLSVSILFGVVLGQRKPTSTAVTIPTEVIYMSGDKTGRLLTLGLIEQLKQSDYLKYVADGKSLLQIRLYTCQSEAWAATSQSAYSVTFTFSVPDSEAKMWLGGYIGYTGENAVNLAANEIIAKTDEIGKSLIEMITNKNQKKL